MKDPHPNTKGDELLSFLMNPESYPVETSNITIVQTHASYVAILDNDVYKVKKSVNLGFLDFSSLDKRKYYCEKEIELNSRLCARIYKSVVPLYKKGDAFTFDAIGEAVEYALHMYRLEDSFFLSNLLAEGEAGENDIGLIISTLVSFYNKSAKNAKINKYATPESIQVNTEENFSQLKSFSENLVDPVQLEVIEYFTQEFFKTESDLLYKRIDEGWIRDCHGDLHMEHIHIQGGSVCIFDCIEFNDRFRYGDIVNDYSFLAMDLDFQDFNYLSKLFTDLMAQATNDRDAFRLIDFYKSYRATVRAKVNCFIQNNPDISSNTREISQNHAREYLLLAANYAASGSRPLVIALSGMVGSGKSALAKRLSSHMGWEWLSSDRIRKELSDLPLYDRPDENTRKLLYSQEMTESTYSTLFNAAETMLDLGKTVIMDATFSNPAHRERLEKLAMDEKTDFFMIETFAPESILRERLHRRYTNTDEISDARLEDFDFLSKRYKSPVEIPDTHKIRVETSGSHLESLRSALHGIIDRRLNNLRNTQ